MEVWNAETERENNIIWYLNKQQRVFFILELEISNHSEELWCFLSFLGAFEDKKMI